MHIAGELPAHQALGVVHQIGFHAVNDLEIGIFGDPSLAALRLMGLREGLYDAVVGDRQSLHAEMIGLFDDIGGRGDRVHIGHLGVAVQLHPLLPGMILPRQMERRDLLDAVNAVEHHFLVKGVEIHHSVHTESGSLFEHGLDLRHVRRVEPELHAQGIRIIREGHRVNDPLRARRAALCAADLAADRDLSGILSQLVHGDGLLAEILAVDHRGVLGEPLFPVTFFLFFRELLLLLRLLRLLLPALPDAAHPLADLLFPVLEEAQLHRLLDLQGKIRLFKAGPLPEDLIQILHQVPGALFGQKAPRHFDLRLLRTEFHLRGQKQLVKERALRLQLQQHAGAVKLIKDLRRVGGRQLEMLDDHDLHVRLREDLFFDGVPDLIQILLLHPVRRGQIHLQAVLRLVDGDPVHRHELQQIRQLLPESQRRERVVKLHRFSVHRP